MTIYKVKKVREKKNINVKVPGSKSITNRALMLAAISDSTCKLLVAILVSAVITFGLRVLPFLVFQEGKELPDQIKRLGMVLPSSIMAVLIVYCLKDVGDSFMADGLWKLIAAAITAVSYRWKHNTLISILLGTVSYMLFLHFFG